MCKISTYSIFEITHEYAEQHRFQQKPYNALRITFLPSCNHPLVPYFFPNLEKADDVQEDRSSCAVVAPLFQKACEFSQSFMEIQVMCTQV